MAKTAYCPSLFCNGIGIPANQSKKFSVGGAIIGNCVGGLFGPAGAIIGTAAGGMNHKGKTKFVCPKCGRTWEMKI